MIRIYPTKEQQKYITKLLGCCRKVYNICLSKKIDEYTQNNRNIDFKEMGRYFFQDLTKDTNYDYLNEHSTQVLKSVLFDMYDAYNRFFKNNAGFPKFRSKHDTEQSCNFNTNAISTVNDYSSSYLTLTKKLKNLKFECSDEYKEYLQINKNNIKNITLTKTKTNKYFLSVLVDGDVKQLEEPINNIIGIDLGIKTFVTCSEGTIYENLNFLKKDEKKIKRLNKKLSKKVKGSKNKEKARLKLAVAHEKLNDKKLDYIHNITTQLVNENQIIVIEDLNVAGMMKNHNLAKAIQAMSFAEFRRQLEYKCLWYGRELIVVSRFFPSSKKCNKCGFINKKLKLSDREWVCPCCGVEHDRDVNAAINLMNEGKNMIGKRQPEFKLVDYPTMDDRQFIDLKSSGRVKQETEIEQIV